MSNADINGNSSSNSSLKEEEEVLSDYSIPSSPFNINNDYDFNNKHPEKWNKMDVKQWLKWCSQEYALNDIPFDKFEMNGKIILK
jgi:hypothetical protein